MFLKTVLAAMLLLPCISLFAQTQTNLNGTVFDPSGAAVPGATITITNIATNQVRETTSDEQGYYNLAQVTPGEYRLLAKKQGFADVSVQGVRLLVNTPSTVNLTFENVGSTSTLVEVTADAVQINTSDATLGNSFGTTPILQLPFEGRNVAKILSLQAGVTWVGDTDTVNGGVNAATDRGGVVNGGRSDQSNVTLDGVDVNDQQTRSAFTSVLRVTLDSVQEFRVVTTNANAESSRGSGAQVTLITKSGTNEIHGSAYWYLRNREFNANTFFNNVAGLPTPKLNRNIGGASLGGPIVRNKLFLFGNYEGRRDSLEQSIQRIVPTASLRQGIASYIARGGNIVQVSPQELASRLNYAPGANAAALQLFNSYPMPNDFTAGDGLNTAGFRFNAPIKNKFDTYIARMDYVLNDRHSFFARGQLQQDSEEFAPQFPGAPPNSRDLTYSKGIAVGWNGALRPNFLVTTRYGLTRQKLMTAGVGTYEAVTWRPLSDPVGLTRSFQRTSPTHHLSQDFNWLKGSHNFQFGGSFRQYTNDRLAYDNSYFGASSNSSWLTSSGQILSAPFTTGADNVAISPGSRTAFNDAVSMVFGLVTQVNSRYNYLPQNGQVQVLGRGVPNPRKFVGQESELYFQDTWKLNRQLTVTAGVRYMFWPAVYEANKVQTSPSIPLSEWFDTRVANANAGLAGQTGLSPISFNLITSPNARPLYDDLHNWSPRFAIAYSPEGQSGLGKLLFGGPGKSVFRAGWGMYYDVFGAGLIRAFDASALGLSTNTQNSSGRLTLADAPRFTGTFNIPQSLVTPPPPASFPVTQGNIFQITNSLDDKLRAPYVMRFNASFQREIKNGLTLTLAYVASEGRRTMTSEDLATPLNIRDPQSGSTWYDAARQLVGQMNMNSRRQVVAPLTDAQLAQVRSIPYFENMFPGLAGGGLTATQAALRLMEEVFPDSTAWLESTDRFGDPAASRLGRFAFYSPQFSYLRAIRSVGASSYHSMQTSVRKIFRNGDQFDFNWTWSHSFDLGSVTENQQSANDGLRGVIISPYNRKLMRAESDFDQRHNFNANYVYNLPLGKGRHFFGNAGTFANLLVGGWQLAGLYRQTTGLPVSVGHGRTWPTNYNVTGWATQVGQFKDGTNKNAPAPVTTGTPQQLARLSGPNIFQNPAEAVQSFGFTYAGEIGNRN
ncbi:MAG TPA: carboxypeptidase regulatory-like domain-containing protein, partial [Bryobacteraceae bacterium]|nr:carboxypeptidase regulatory-like domain-containing protein [Bryobacteraceae bacterium]